jgi:hypothetical protein
LKNNLSTVRDLMRKGEYSQLDQLLKDGGVNIDRIAAIDRLKKQLDLAERKTIALLKNFASEDKFTMEKG